MLPSATSYDASQAEMAQNDSHLGSSHSGTGGDWNTLNGTSDWEFQSANFTFGFDVTPGGVEPEADTREEAPDFDLSFSGQAGPGGTTSSGGLPSSNGGSGPGFGWGDGGPGFGNPFAFLASGGGGDGTGSSNPGGDSTPPDSDSRDDDVLGDIDTGGDFDAEEPFGPELDPEGDIEDILGPLAGNDADSPASGDGPYEAPNDVTTPDLPGGDFFEKPEGPPPVEDGSVVEAEIPEPATWAAFGSGLLLLLGRRRSRVTRSLRPSAEGPIYPARSFTRGYSCLTIPRASGAVR